MATLFCEPSKFSMLLHLMNLVYFLCNEQYINFYLVNTAIFQLIL